MKVIWTLEADQDRKEIRKFIAADNLRAAARMDQRIMDAATKLGSFPMLGRAGRVPGTRELIPHRNYRLIYQLDAATNTVWIIALIHTARQWPPVQE